MLVMLQGWIKALLLLLDHLILRKHETTNIEIESKALIDQYEILGKQAYDLSRMNQISLYQAAKQLQTINAPALTIYAHARDQEKQVRRERNKKIAQLRSAGYRIQDIAKIAGVSPATVSRVLCAAKLPSQQQIKQSHPALAIPNFLT